MKKIALLFCLILFSSLVAIGQEVIGYGIFPRESDEWETPLDLENNRSVIVDVITGASANFDHVDPFMPIAVPPKDLSSRFPIKRFPKDFPSRMPIYGLKKEVPGSKESDGHHYFIPRLKGQQISFSGTADEIP